MIRIKDAAGNDLMTIKDNGDTVLNGLQVTESQKQDFAVEEEKKGE